MSRDQKPGKVRVVSSGGSTEPAHPLRRASDRTEAQGSPENAQAEVGGSGRGGFLLSMLFLLGCGAGGTLFVVVAPFGAAS